MNELTSPASTPSATKPAYSFPACLAISFKKSIIYHPHLCYQNETHQNRLGIYL